MYIITTLRAVGDYKQILLVVSAHRTHNEQVSDRRSPQSVSTLKALVVSAENTQVEAVTVHSVTAHCVLSEYSGFDNMHISEW